MYYYLWNNSVKGRCLEEFKCYVYVEFVSEVFM